MNNAKRFGEAAEHYVMFKLLGDGDFNAIKLTDNWIGADIMVKTLRGKEYVQVKARNAEAGGGNPYFHFDAAENDWIAFVLKDGKDYDCYLVPIKEAVKAASKKTDGSYRMIPSKLRGELSVYRDNWLLNT